MEDICMHKKYAVKLSDIEREKIHEVSNDPATSKTVRNRCNILLMSDESVGKPPSQEEISKRCKVSDVTVYQTGKDYATKGLEYALRRRVHEKPPVTPIVSGEAEARIIALACSEPPKGYGRWSVRLLTKRVIELQIMDTVGRETVRRTLKKRNSSLT
jgi:hypothetical protein